MESYEESEFDMDDFEASEKKRRKTVLNQQFALRRKKRNDSPNSSSSTATGKSRTAEKIKAKQEERDQLDRTKLKSAEFTTTKISGLTISVSDCLRRSVYVSEHR